jgi:hypothetical protein
VIWIEHEPGSSGVDAYKHTARKLAAFTVFPDRPTGAKEVRAEPWASQCAAKNVYLVEDGTWDLPGWITEHCSFPLGTLKDRVDSASGAFAKLVNARRPELLRVFHFGRRKDKTLRIVVGSREQLAGKVLEQRHLLVSVTDPPPVGKVDRPAPESNLLLGSLMLAFADLDPADLQEMWGQPVPLYDQPADQLIMTKEMGKKLWSFLLRKRDPFPELFVLQDDQERRVLSLAYAIADVLRLERPQALSQVKGEESQPRTRDLPPNRHVYEMTKRSRAMVV